MSRVQLALRVSDLDGLVDFYAKLFGTAPAKRRPGYANFAITEPLNHAGSDGDSGYWIPTSGWSACWSA